MQTVLSGEVDLETALSPGRMSAEQKEFLGAQERFTSAAGGFGAGKTVISCAKALLAGYSVPNGLFLVSRLNYPALRDTTRRTFLEMCPLDWVKGGRKGWRETENRLVFKNNTEFLFRHLDMTDVQHRAHIKSLNLSGFFVDQAEEISKDTFLTLIGRLRRKTDPGFHRGWLSSNPNGHDYIWEMFFNEDRDEKLKALFKGFTLPTTSNRNLAEGYLESMLAVYPDDWAQRYIYGYFTEFTDLVYKDWNPKVHVYDDKQEWPYFRGSVTPPLEWPTTVGIDIGGVDPWHFSFHAKSPEGFIFKFAEIHVAGILIRDLADEYFKIMQGRNFEGMTYDYENQQAAFEMDEHGIHGNPAIKDVKAGIFKVAQYLHPDKRITNPLTGASPAPRYMVARSCSNTIREYSSWKWEMDRNGNPTGEPVDKDNHSCDSDRYNIHTFRPSPDKVVPVKTWQNPQLDELSRLFYRDIEKQEARRKRLRSRPGFGYRQVMR